MNADQIHDITGLLQRWQQGDHAAFETLVPLVYKELRRRAAAQLKVAGGGGMVTPTDLVHELYLKLVDQNRAHFENRVHFLHLAAQLMRRILIDLFRSRRRAKRGGPQPTVQLSETIATGAPNQTDFEALNTALNHLERLDKRMCEVVQLKFFTGLNQEEISTVLKISIPTVQRDWRAARLWLFHHLKRGQGAPDEP